MPEESGLADAGAWFPPALTLPCPERAPSLTPAQGPHPAPCCGRGVPSAPVLFGSPPLDVPGTKLEGRIATCPRWRVYKFNSAGWVYESTVRAAAPRCRWVTFVAVAQLSRAVGCVHAIPFILQRNSYKDPAESNWKPEFEGTLHCTATCRALLL